MNYIDLTHIIKEEMPVYPGTEPPQLMQANTIKKDGFVEHILTMYSHTGTHMDAPAHLIDDGKTLDQFPLDELIGKAFVLDCTKVEGEITLQLIKEQFKNIGHYDFLILKTGWSTYWGTDEYYGGYPYLSQEACRYLTQFNLKGIALDTISIDQFNEKLINHKIILSKDMVIIENLKLANELPQEMMVYFLPLHFKDSDGAPIRAFGALI